MDLCNIERRGGGGEADLERKKVVFKLGDGDILVIVGDEIYIV